MLGNIDELKDCKNEMQQLKTKLLKLKTQNNENLIEDFIKWMQNSLNNMENRPDFCDLFLMT